MLVISTKRKRDGSHVRYTPMTKYTRWFLRVRDPDLTSGATSVRSQRQKKHLENVEKLTRRASEIEKMGENVVWVDPNEFPDFANQFKMYNSEAPTGFFDRSHDARKSSKAKGRKKRDFTPLRFLMGESGVAALYNVKDESSGSECTPTLKSLNQALKQSIVSARLCEANVLKVLHGWQGCGPHVSLAPWQLLRDCSTHYLVRQSHLKSPSNHCMKGSGSHVDIKKEDIKQLDTTIST
jgi:hypothetical protein